MFGFQRLDVYKAAVGFLGLACKLLSKIPRGNADLSDQLRRAALSVPLNIAEGRRNVSRHAVRFYPIARGSALECAAILDALETIGAVDENDLKDAREILERV